MKQKYLITGLVVAAFTGSLTLLTSCVDDLNMNAEIDESAYSGIYENNGYLRDGNSNLVSNVVELYKDTYTTSVKMGFSRVPGSNTSAQVAFDADYLTVYNEEHGTDFELYPERLVSFVNDGKLTVDHPSKSAYTDVTIRADETVVENKTYILPVAITNTSSDITVKDEEAAHCIYLIKDIRKLDNLAFKGEGAVRAFVFFDGTNPLNALAFELENGKMLWDVVSPFAANTGWDPVAQRPYLKCNDYIQFLLDNNETFLQPLRKRGMKVVLSVVGGRDMTGVAQLSEQGAKDFARELAQYCYAYNLDGVCFDDEYTEAPDVNNPALANRSEEAAARLCYETKKAMPDKLVAVYVLGNMTYNLPKVDESPMSEWVDILFADYGLNAAAVIKKGVESINCAGQSMEFEQGKGGNLNPVQIKDNNAGWFMGFSPKVGNFESVFNRLYGGVEELYGAKLKAPTVFYKDNDATPYQYPDDLQ